MNQKKKRTIAEIDANIDRLYRNFEWSMLTLLAVLLSIPLLLLLSVLFRW